jgi:hypothetical protein
VNGEQMWEMDQARAAADQEEKVAFFTEKLDGLTEQHQTLSRLEARLAKRASEIWLSKTDDARAEGLREAVAMVRDDLTRLDAEIRQMSDVLARVR